LRKVFVFLDKIIFTIGEAYYREDFTGVENSKVDILLKVIQKKF